VIRRDRHRIDQSVVNQLLVHCRQHFPFDRGSVAAVEKHLANAESSMHAIEVSPDSPQCRAIDRLDDVCLTENTATGRTAPAQIPIAAERDFLH